MAEPSSSVVIRQLTKSDQIFQALLVPIQSQKPSLILTDKKSVYICDFFKKNGLHITKKLSVYKGTILKIASIQIPKSPLKALLVLISTNDIILVRYDKGVYQVGREISLVDMMKGESSKSVDIGNPIIATGDHHVIIYSTRRMIVIIPIESLFNHANHTIVYPFGRFDVVGIKLISANMFEMISRDSSFQYRLIVYKIGDDDRISIKTTYNPFKEIPRLLITLPNKYSLVVCDGSHLIYPYPHLKITKNVMDSTVKLTKVSSFKVLSKELKVCSYQIIDKERILIMTEDGEIYMEFIQFNDIIEEKTLQLQKWELFKLGKLPPASNILHINENLFLSYSKESMNCFFKIGSNKPYIEVLNYFQLNHFFKKNSIVSNTQYNHDTTPVVDINRLKLVSAELYIKVQSSLNNSSISFKFPHCLSPENFIDFHIDKESKIWFRGSIIIAQNKTAIKVLKFHQSNFSLILETTFKSTNILQCYYDEDKLIIITPDSVIRDNHILYQCEADDSITLSSMAGNKIVIATKDQHVHIINDSTSQKRKAEGVLCISGDDAKVVLGFDNGIVEIDGKEKQISSEPIIQVIVKDQFVVAVDSDFKIYKIQDDDVVENKVMGNFYKIFNVDDTDSFIIKNNEQLSINSFNSSGKLVTKLLKITSIPEFFTVNDGFFIYEANSKLRAVKLLDEPVDQVSQLRFDELIIKSLLVRVDKTFPVLVVVTLKNSKSFIRLIDLESFKVIDTFEMKAGEEIMDIIKTDFMINIEDETLDLDLTRTDLDLVQMELFNNGFLINTSDSNEDGEPCNYIKLFTIGGDMKFKFHYLLKSQQSNYNVDSYKLLKFNDYVISSGTFLTFFKIGINDKFKINKEKVINEDNFLENSIFKIHSAQGDYRAKIFNTNLIGINDEHIVVSDVLKGLNFYNIRSTGKGVIVTELEILSKDQFPLESTIVAMEIINDCILVFADQHSNIYIYKFEIVKNKVLLEKMRFFNLNIQSLVNVIKSLDLNENHLCLIGCSNGEVLVLDLFDDLNHDKIGELNVKKANLNLEQNNFIDDIVNRGTSLYSLKGHNGEDLWYDDAENEESNIIDLRLFDDEIINDAGLPPLSDLKL